MENKKNTFRFDHRGGILAVEFAKEIFPIVLQNSSWGLVGNAQKQCVQWVQWEHQCHGGSDKDKLHQFLRALEH